MTTYPLRECPSSEDLAALVDNRLASAERERLLVHVDSCELCYEVYVETARHGKESGNLAVPAPARGRALWSKWTPIGIAAALLIGILVISLRDRSESIQLDGGYLAAALPPLQSPALADPRSGRQGFAPVRSLDRLSFQVGNCVVALHLAAVQENRALLESVGSQLALAIDPIPELTSARAALSEARNAGFARTEVLLARMEGRLADRLDRFFLNLGKLHWAGHLAVDASDTTVFESAMVSRFLRVAARNERLSPRDRESLQAVVILLDSRPSPKTPAWEDALIERWAELDRSWDAWRAR